MTNEPEITVERAAPHPLSAAEIDEFVLYRFRLRELIHLFNVWMHYKLEVRDRDTAQTLAVVVHTWIYSFFDPKALDVRRVWRRAFPWMRNEIGAWAAKFKPYLVLLKRFRHTTGAHFSRSIESHNRARKALEGKIGRAGAELFVTMAIRLLDEEEKRPELSREIAEYGLDGE